jgi:hypothetical protein
MEIGKIIDDSFVYTKEGLVGRWNTWLFLIISCIIFPLFMGFMLRIYRGAKPLPAVDNWGEMFIDGIKLLIVGLIYSISIFIIGVVLIGSTGVALLLSVNLPIVDPGAIIGLLAAILFGAIIFVVVAIIIGLIVAKAGVRFARTNSFGEAFNFVAIYNHIDISSTNNLSGNCI